jgi:hypothetical protein
MPRPSVKKVQVSFSITPALKAELELESWEMQQTLSQYIAGLLERRGKWSRTASCYDLMMEPRELK